MNRTELKDFPLLVLRLQTLETLSSSLNPKKRLLSESGRLRDWKGLADFAHLTPEQRLKVENAFKHDYTRSIITIWCDKPDKPSVQTLQDALQSMGRFDTIDDVRELLVADCNAASRVPALDAVAVDRSKALTLQDVQALASGAPLPTYDAMVLFGEADEDVAFGSHLIERCEEAGLCMFVPQRDLVAGTIEHETSSKIIAQRCKKVIAVFSPSFVDGERNLFLTGFAQHVGIMDGSNDKIIPVILRPCNLPVQYTMYHKLVYDPSRKYVNFWDKLLRVTFDLKNIPTSLKTYDFFLANQDAASQRPPPPTTTTTTTPTPPSMDSIIINQYSDSDSRSLNTSCFSTDTTDTAMTALSVARLIDVLPDPPQADPDSGLVPPEVQAVKSRSKLKQLKDRLTKPKKIRTAFPN